MHHPHWLTIALLSTALAVVPGAAQEPGSCYQGSPAAIPGAAPDYRRLLELTGDASPSGHLLRRGAAQPRCTNAGPWGDGAEKGGPTGLLSILPVRTAAHVNTGYPRDINNGAAWTGRGLTWSMDGGVRFRWGVVDLVLAPTVVYQQNRSFDLMPAPFDDRTGFAFPWDRKIDWPQRMGDEPFWTLSPGQSRLQLSHWGIRGGVSTENLWWGPGIRSSLLMSSTAPGFDHVFLGTARPTDVWLGHLEVEAVWGRLEESEYFDSDPTNDRRLFTGIVASFQPRGLPELYIGGSRVFYQPLPEGGLPGYEYFRFFEGFSPDFLRERYGSTQDRTDQMIAVYVRWVLPESGFETYAEWARNDRAAHLDDLIQEIDHTQAYTLGFQKVIGEGRRRLRLGGELSHLDRSITRLDRSTPPWYIHNFAHQGYTHRGQLLGAWIGPGSQAQYLAADLFDTWGSVGLYMERVRYNSDEYYATQSRWLEGPGTQGRPADQRACGVSGDWCHDLELTGGLKGSYLYEDLIVSSELAYSHRLHRNFAEDDHNWTIRLSLGWHP